MSEKNVSIKKRREKIRFDLINLAHSEYSNGDRAKGELLMQIAYHWERMEDELAWYKKAFKNFIEEDER